jgi:hypothetical protein
MNETGAYRAITLAPTTGGTTMRIRDIIADAIGAAALFGVGYGALVIGHGLGW